MIGQYGKRLQIEGASELFERIADCADEFFSRVRRRAPLRMNVRPSDEIYALRTISILNSCGLGIEAIMKHLSEADLGHVSDEFFTTLIEVEKGAFLEESLIAMNRRVISKYPNSATFRRMVEALISSVRGDVGLEKSCKDYADMALQEKKIRNEEYQRQLRMTTTGFIIFGVCLPLFALPLESICKGVAALLMTAACVITSLLAISTELSSMRL